MLPDTYIITLAPWCLSAISVARMPIRIIREIRISPAGKTPPPNYYICAICICFLINLLLYLFENEYICNFADNSLQVIAMAISCSNTLLIYKKAFIDALCSLAFRTERVLNKASRFHNFNTPRRCIRGPSRQN